jgi:hypothetical protein
MVVVVGITLAFIYSTIRVRKVLRRIGIKAAGL